MIFDCFTFFDEVDIAEIRIRELASVPDLVHVVVHADVNFRGIPHEAPIDELEMGVAPFLAGTGRLRVQKIRPFCDGFYPREIESAQRNAILHLLAHHAKPDDVVIISDVDEIPKASAVAEYAASKTGLHSLGMRQHCYYLDGVVRNTRWPHARIMRRKDMEWFGSPDHIRLCERILPQIKDAGWHFSWCGGVEAVQKKLRSFSHHEVDTPEMNDPDRIRRAMDGDRQFWNDVELTFIPIDESFPACVRENPGKWQHLIHGA
jgi:beta-1,4-mannosyl-glycoprotein beta-1,4-N-acetylglucosaminyltransferase